MASSKYKWHSFSVEEFPFKRQKVSRACQLCRQKKMRCDGKKPCARCDQHDSPCVYDEQTNRRTPTARKVKHEDDVSNSDSSGAGGAAVAESKHGINHADTKQCYHHHHHPSSPIPSTSPISKKQHLDEQYIRKHLKRISFTNAMYESMRQHPRTNAITRSYLFATSLPPLMLDFFNLTSQPFQIWTSFTRHFREWMRLNTIETSDAVTHEALALFAKHNLLYGSLFDFGELNHSLTSGFLMQVQAIQDEDSPNTMILCAILSLVFYAAFQSLATSYQDIAQRLEDCANLCFQEAQRRFLRDTFMSTSRELDREWLLQLTRVSVLLTHYACTAIDEEAAYMTLRLGIGYAARCSLTSSNNNMMHDAELDVDECKRVKRLLSVLDAWQTWLSFYLHRDDWIIESLTGIGSSSDPPIENKAVDCNPGNQSWAIYATQAYTDFLKRVSSTNMTLQDIKQRINHLACWSQQQQPPTSLPGNESLDEEPQQQQQILPTTSPTSILALYHHTLAIQLYFCQIPQSLQFFIHQQKTMMNQDDDPPANESSNYMLDLCDAAAAEIVHIVDNLTVEYPTTSPDENARTASREPIAHAVLYPIFLAASMSVLCLKLRRPSPTADMQDASDTKVIGNRDEDMEFATSATKEESLTMTPLRKLQRLLHPICSQIDVANVITRPLGGIHATTNDIATTTTTKTEMGHQHVADSGCSMDVTTPMLSTASVQQQQRMMMRAPPRHNEQLWPATTTADLDHSAALIEDQAFYSDSMTSRGMVHVMSRRNDIDREQLEKLSHKRDLHYNTTGVTSTLSSSMDVFGVYAAAPPAPPLPVSSMYFGNTSKQVTMQQQAMPTTLHHHHHHNFSGQKRQHPLQHQQQHMQQQYQTKRIRGHSTSSYESMMPMNYLRGGTAAAAAAAAVAISPTTPRRFSYGSSSGTNMTEYPDQVAFNMYTNDYFQLMDMSEPPPTPEPALTVAAAAAAAAAAGGGGSMAPSSSTVVANGMSSSNSSPAMFSMGPPAAATVSTTTTNNSTPLLPKPNPKKRVQTVRKSWAGQQKETEPFHGSMMETLHMGGGGGHTSNTAAAAAAMMDSFLSSTASTSPTVTATNTEQQQQQQSSTLANDDNNNMWYFIESARFAQAPTAAAAAAAAAAPTPTPTASWPSSSRNSNRQQRQVYHHHQHHHHHHAKIRQHHYPPARQPTPSSSSSSAAMLNQDSWIALSPHTTSKVDPTSDQDMLDATTFE
ncbi:hypothetical protein O0I10_006766 [Lichtheimia ornata]|uniref:Zn(2)-C6 fungal-type domain-containing protein n=1 Tax=Lichtheimia ornata TaxID=688661 RepID=A0AAD7V2A8_9FUNG|nr:uncharacterized protein O0I10_006766 [Lichtheimia ornata]KAJ8657464.1 hypothetical protein O0I10_006766 [Lichtheimia ornata]